MGSFGVERKNIINNLFKRIIEMSVPNFVKYLFWGSVSNRGIFDDQNLLTPDQIEKKKRLSKYQLEELKNKEGYK
jgi:hypothetical protein